MKTLLLGPAVLAVLLVASSARAHEAQEAQQAQEDSGLQPAHFHHVRLNVTDPAKTIDFYAKNLGAVETKYHGRVPALFTERSFLLFNKVDSPPPYMPHSANSSTRHRSESVVT